MNDRRPLFFFCSALLCAVLVPVADPQFRWVPLAVAVVYLLLTLAAYLDIRGRR